MQLTKKASLTKTATAAALLAIVAGCTKPRPAEFDYHDEDKIFKISDLQNASISIETGNQASQLSEAAALRAEGETETVKVSGVQADARLAPMFNDLWLTGRPGNRYSIKLDVNRKYVTAYKVVGDAAGLSAVEQQLAMVARRALPNGQSSIQHLVPLFQFEVEAYGIVEKAKNDLKEETHRLELTETEWEQAKYIKFVPLSSRRKMVQAALDGNNESEANQIFLSSRIDNGLFTRSQLEQNLRVRVAEPAIVTGSAGGEERNSLFHTRLNNRKLELWEVTTLDSPTLSADDRRLIQANDSASSHQRCSDELKARLPENLRESCVIVLRYRVAASRVVAERVVEDHDGTRGSTIRYIDAVPSHSSSPDHGVSQPSQAQSLVRIAPNALPEQVATGGGMNLDPRYTLEVDKVRGSEFFMRRTLQDSPNGFQYTFAGVAGELEIVRFVFEESRVRVVRTAPLIDRPGSTEVDVETLMSIPARYYKTVTTNAQGEALARPDYVRTTPDSRGAIAVLDWADNNIPNVSSPLNYYGLEECFTGAREKTVSDVDQRLTDGLLNFTISSTYAANPGVGCADLYIGYFDAVQANFTFKERVSFKKKQTASDEPLLDLPYEAQKLLGFGLFTYSKKQPDAFGNTHLDGTEIPLPAIFDIRAGKTIHYVLGGAPTEEPLRQMVIDATQQVINDWDEAFRKAFKGTALEREGRYIDLAVEGRDIGAGQMGDLDRNYVYWVGKQTDAPILGLGGAHPSPRSGEVQAASSFIYGGNMLRSVDSIIKRAKARRAYHAKMDVEWPEETEEQGAAEEGSSGAPAGEGAAGGAPSASSIVTGVHRQANPNAGNTQVDQRIRRLLEQAQSRTFRLAERAGLGQSLGKIKRETVTGSRAAIARDLRRNGIAIKQAAQQSEASVRESVLTQLRRNNRAAALYQAFHAAMESGDVHNRAKLTTLVNEQLITLLQGQIRPEEMRRLRAETARVKAVSRLLERLEASDYCAYSSAAAEAGGGKLLTDDLLDQLEADPSKEREIANRLLMAMYKPTLAHELGHNLGLRHNFIGSFDKANWKFSEDEETTRDYSSVMDYATTDHDLYDGLGPYDVHAIRAAYAGLVELHPEIVERAVEAGINVVDGKYITLADLKTFLRIGSWRQLTSAVLSRIALKQYKFCSDEESGQSPTCQTFDRGATPLEIVRAEIDDYRSFYSLTNFPNGRLQFGWWDMGGYIGNVFGRFIRIRQFLEETFYQIIHASSDEEVQALIEEYLPAVIEGMQFLHEVVRTPDAPAGQTGDRRFVEVELENGVKLPVERKALDSLVVDSNSDRISVRGIEFDKVIALLTLTERSFGFPRYERVSLRLSYPDFESMLTKGDLAKMPTIKLLHEILTNTLQAAAPSPAGTLMLPSVFKSGLTDMIRIYAIIGSILNLDINGLEASDNLSSHFRVMSGRTVPQGVTAIAELGASLTSPTTLKYYAPETAKVSGAMIRRASAIDRSKAIGQEIKADYQAWVIAKVAQKASEAQAQAEAQGATGAEGEAGGDGDASLEAAMEAATQPAPAAPAPATASSDDPEAAAMASLGDRIRREFEDLLRQIEIARLERQINQKLAELPDGAGPKTIQELEPIVMETVMALVSFQEIVEQLGPFAGLLIGEQLNDLANALEALSARVPVVAVLVDLIPAEQLKLELHELVNPVAVINGQRAHVFRNSEILNQIFYSVHPEYNN